MDGICPCPQRSEISDCSVPLAQAAPVERDKWSPGWARRNLLRELPGRLRHLLGDPEQTLAPFHLLPDVLGPHAGPRPDHGQVVEQIGAFADHGLRVTIDGVDHDLNCLLGKLFGHPARAALKQPCRSRRRGIEIPGREHRRVKPPDRITHDPVKIVQTRARRVNGVRQKRNIPLAEGQEPTAAQTGLRDRDTCRHGPFISDGTECCCPCRSHESDMTATAAFFRFYGQRFMRATRPLPALLLSLVLGLAGLAGPLTGNRGAQAVQPIAIDFSYDRPLDASMAPFVLAASHGLFATEGLSVTTHTADGSGDAIARVASGASELALVDVNELIRFRGRAEAPPIKAVFMLFNQAPYAIVARKSRGIRALSDIPGKTLGVAESDLSFRLWPALARQNGIRPESVKVYRMSAAVREPILSAGQVDAVAGFSSLSAVNLRDRGVPASDLVVLRYNDYGIEAYGFAIIVNPAFAAARPDAVKGFVRAAIAGTQFAIRQPEAAVDDVVARMESGNRDLE